MKYARFIYKDEAKQGIVENDMIREISGDIFNAYEILNSSYKLEEVRLLAPCTPSKVVAVGLNYIDHIKEMDLGTPKNPVLFIKLPHTVIGPEDTILLPRYTTRVDYEAELAVVIKKLCRNVSQEEALDYVLGATCLNDVTERDLQKVDGQWTRSKNFETFCPIGPYIVDKLDYNSLDIELTKNGKVKQSSNTSNLLWNVQELISFISEIMPLYPGDVVTTGTTFGVGPMKDGDEVAVTIKGIGTLNNKVKRLG
ncbi:MAG: fumarylacetoacetate hydrolase family protein [Clostridia bacterium]|nr:fumarylacetoacetate hydrolase family protein [Clostridia bacterium]